MYQTITSYTLNVYYMSILYVDYISVKLGKINVPCSFFLFQCGYSKTYGCMCGML